MVHGSKVSYLGLSRNSIGEMWEMLPGPAVNRMHRHKAVVRWQLWLCSGWNGDPTHFQYLEKGKIQGYMLTTGVCSRVR